MNKSKSKKSKKSKKTKQKQTKQEIDPRKTMDLEKAIEVVRQRYKYWAYFTTEEHPNHKFIMLFVDNNSTWFESTWNKNGDLYHKRDTAPRLKGIIRVSDLVPITEKTELNLKKAYECDKNFYFDYLRIDTKNQFYWRKLGYP